MISKEQYRFTPVYIPANFKRHSNHWILKSWKAKDNRLVDLYSQLEYFNYVLFEVNPKVHLLCEQPLHINCAFNGSRLNYIFDLWVKWRDGREELIEVKPYEDLVPSIEGGKKPNNWSVISKWCCENGYACRFVTDREVLSNRVYLANARQILRYSPKYVDLSFRSELLKKIPQDVSVYLKDLQELYAHIPIETFMSTLTFTIINGELCSDIEIFPFSPETRISGGKHEA